MKRIDSSFQCCIRDGSRSATYVMQLRCANHLKVLCSKGMVLNVQAKGIVLTVSGKCKEAERKCFVEDVSRGIICWQNYWYPRADRRTVADNCLLATGQPALRRQDLYTGFYLEQERLRCWWAQKLCGNFHWWGRLFVNRLTVHTATQFRYDREMRQQASDWIIVVMKFL